VDQSLDDELQAPLGLSLKNNFIYAEWRVDEYSWLYITIYFFRIWHCILLQIGSNLLNVLADIALCSTTMVAFSDSVYIA